MDDNIYYTHPNTIVTYNDALVHGWASSAKIHDPYSEMQNTLSLIKERLLILEPNFEQMKQYPALKAACDNYKLIEALVSEGDNTDV